MPLLGYAFSFQLPVGSLRLPVCSWLVELKNFQPLKRITSANCQLCTANFFELQTQFHSFIRSVTEKIPPDSSTFITAFIRLARISIFFSPWPL
jgi:hypothetical protein